MSTATPPPAPQESQPNRPAEGIDTKRSTLTVDQMLERYGEKFALQWLLASDQQRAALENYLAENTHLASPLARGEDMADKFVNLSILQWNYRLVEAQREKLEDVQMQYVTEMGEQQQLAGLVADDVELTDEQKKRWRPELLTLRLVQEAMLDELLETGTLSYAGVQKRLRKTDAGAVIPLTEVARTYMQYFLLLMQRKQIEASPDA